MAERFRSLAAALNLPPEADAFIESGVRPSKPPSRPKTKSDSTSQAAGQNRQNSPRTRKTRRRTKRTTAAPPNSQAASGRARVAITTRFRQDTADALRRASLERKLRGESLHSQQDIIEKAVQAWLAGNDASKRPGFVSAGK